MSKHNKQDSLVKNSAIISILVLFGKALGFVKQSIIAWAFGATGVTDVYFAADGYTSVFGEIMKTSIAPTVLTRYVKNSPTEETEKSRNLVRECLVFFSFLGIILTLAGIIFAPYISRLIGISYSSSQKETLVFYLRFLAPTVFFTTISGVAQGYLDANKRYIPAKLCSFFFSVCIILSILLFRNSLGVRSLLYGFVAGYGLHTLLMLVLLIRRTGIKIVNPFKDPEFVYTIKHFFPLLIGTSVVDLGHLVDKIVASTLLTGSLSVLYYGQVVSNDIVNSVLITSLGTVLLPTLTRSVSRNESIDKVRIKIQNVLSTITAVTGLLMVLYLSEGLDLIRIFFERGNFTSDDSVSVNYIVLFYSLGFMCMAQREVLVKAHYSFQDTKTPMINSIIGVVVNIVGSVFLSKTMGVSGIALATSISMLSVMVLSWITIKKHIKSSIFDRKMLLNYTKIMISICISLIIGRLMTYVLSDVNKFVRLIANGMIISIVYFLLLVAMRESGALKIKQTFKNRISRGSYENR